jgi:hypothetical protein
MAAAKKHRAADSARSEAAACKKSDFNKRRSERLRYLPQLQ